VLAQTARPRNDVAHPFSWDLTNYGGNGAIWKLSNGTPAIPTPGWRPAGSIPKSSRCRRIVLAQGNGQEMSVPRKDLQERRETMTSLMPDYFSDAIKEQDFYDLVAFLASRRAKQSLESEVWNLGFDEWHE
jgi:hypothetical protein